MDGLVMEGSWRNYDYREAEGEREREMVGELEHI